MDKSKIAWANMIMNGLYILLCVFSLVCERIYSFLWSVDRDVAKIFFGMGSVCWPFIILLIPLTFVPAHITLSTIGIVKSKKVFPYLVTTIVPVILWFTVLVTCAKYV